MDRPQEPQALDASNVETTPKRVPSASAAAFPIWPAPLRFALLVATAETLLFAARLAAGFNLAVWLVLHLGLIGAAAAYLWQHRASLGDVSPYALTLVAALISGPAGATLAAMALIRHAGEAEHPELLAAWYDRISLAGDADPVTDLYNTVAMGRALQTTQVPPQVFDAVMTRGTLADRQTALGLIARQFQPGYAPALRSALVSPEPVIRVQAAAVAVKVRAELKTSLAGALSAAGGKLAPSAAADLAVALQSLATSGLLEDDDRDRAVAASSRLAAQAITGLGPNARLSPPAQALIETELLASGRFQEFRTLRARQGALALPPPPALGAAHG